MNTSSTLRRAIMYKNTRLVGYSAVYLKMKESTTRKRRSTKRYQSSNGAAIFRNSRAITGNEATCIILHKTEAANWQESYCIYKYLRKAIHIRVWIWNKNVTLQSSLIDHYRSTSKISVLFENKTRMKVQVVHSKSQIRSGRKRSTTSRSTQKMSPFKPFPDPRVALLDFTLSNARQLYSSMGPPSGRKGLTHWLFESPGVSIEF